MNDYTHALESLDRAIERLADAKRLLEAREKGAMQAAFDGRNMASYAVKVMHRMGQSALVDELPKHLDF